MNNQEINNDELMDVLDVVKHYHGYDFFDYSKASLLRRISKFIADNQLDGIYDLKRKLVNEPNYFQHFLQTVTVNVTEVFRDPAFYKSLRENVVPILASYPKLNIWHAGCSTGEEVFSMCILLHEVGLLERCRIYATDINPVNLEKAMAGIVPLKFMKDYTSNYIKAGGTNDFADYYTARYDHVLINKELRKNIVFSQHNLVTDAAFNEFQFICCRNVLIYFNKNLQQRAINLFSESLSPLGILALGLKESLLVTDKQNWFDALDKAHKIYRRKS
jgi:chemotaxis protein methyltransferase CheR